MIMTANTVKNMANEDLLLSYRHCSDKLLKGELSDTEGTEALHDFVLMHDEIIKRMDREEKQ